MTPAELLSDPWAFGPWCWRIDRVELFVAPLPCRGMQGLWPVEDSSEEIALALDDLVGELSPHVTPRTWSGLTLLQPYASAIASGRKRIENRPWRRKIPAGGLWVGLHAGRDLYCPDEELVPYQVCRSTRAQQAREYVSEMLEYWRNPTLPVAVNEPAGPPMWPDAPGVDDLPLGVMLGAMHVAEILHYPTPGSLL